MSAANKETVNKVNEAFIKGDTTAFLDYCKDDVTWNMLGDKTYKGKEAILAFAGTPSEPPKFTIKETIGEGDLVVSNGEMIMKNKDGVAETYAFCDIYKFGGGEIEELTSYVVKMTPAGEASNN
jgi:ketosteroid isomerase-like protein